jgi:hypothetical protein
VHRPRLSGGDGSDPGNAVVAWRAPVAEVSVAYKRILFGTDGSARAAEAGAIAIALAKAGSAELVIVHSYERPEGAQSVLDAAAETAT